MKLAEAVIRLGRVVLDFGRVNRATLHQDGLTPESDTTHTVMLGILACALCERWSLNLSVGRIAELALVHDLVEVYAGDENTLLGEKTTAGRGREVAAFLRLADEFEVDFPWLISRMEEYEKRVSPEARFVKALDKCLPKITHLLNGNVAIRRAGMTKQQLSERYRIQQMEMCNYAGQFWQLLQLRLELVEMVLQEMGEEDEDVPGHNSL